MDQRHRIVVGVLDAVYMDMVSTRRIVAVTPKPVLRRVNAYPALMVEVISVGMGSQLMWTVRRALLDAKRYA